MKVPSEAVFVAILGILGTVSVAFISGLFSLVSLIISKELKLSEFRQAWIDSLREDIAGFVSHAVQVSAYCKMVMQPFHARFQQLWSEAEGDFKSQRSIWAEDMGRREEFLTTTRADFVEMNICSAKIKLRLNSAPHEVDSLALLDQMAVVESILAKGFAEIDSDAVSAATSKMEEIARPLLKTEWNRVRRGEPTFRSAKWASLVLSSVLLVTAILLAFRLPSLLEAIESPVAVQSNCVTSQSNH